MPFSKQEGSGFAVKVAEQDVASLLEHIRHQLPTTWTAWPGGWRDEVELALVDAVLSIRSRYGTATTGVRKRVSLYRHQRGGRADDLTALAGMDPSALGDLLQTRQRTGGALKAEAIVQAAVRLTAVGVRHAVDLDPNSPSQKAAYVGVTGLGPVTWQYLLMLVGKPGVKADTWICRFVEAALGRPVGPPEAEMLLRRAADALEVSATNLDHAIWSHMSRRRAQ